LSRKNFAGNRRALAECNRYTRRLEGREVTSMGKITKKVAKKLIKKAAKHAAKKAAKKTAKALRAKV